MIKLKAKYLSPYLVILISVFQINILAYSQTPVDALRLGGSGIESLSHIQMFQNENKIIAGTFDTPFDIEGNFLENTGENDIFLARLNQNNEAIWALCFGSDFDDEISGLTVDDNAVYSTGSFWLEIQLGEIPLESTKSPKSLFLTKTDAETGDFLWAHTIEGSDVKIITDLENRGETLILSGYFSDTLFIGDTTLIATAPTDMFAASFNKEGSFNWAINLGYSGVNKALETEILSNENIVLAGIFNDTLDIADTTLIAETYDDDIFLACFSSQGQPLWATKAGGVHEENIIGLKTDAQDHIFASGHFVGVINLDNDLTIQSSTGWADLFVLKYDANGEILASRRFGGDELQHNTAIEVTEDHIFLTGNFRGEMTIAENHYNAENQTAGFILRLDHELQPQTGWTLRSPNNNVFPSCLESDGNGNFIVGGGYGAEITGIEMLGPPMGLFDIFLLTYPENSINDLFLPTADFELDVFPNPAKESIHITTSLENFRVELIDIHGKVITSGYNWHKLPVDTLSPGIYFIRISSKKFRETKKVIVRGGD